MSKSNGVSRVTLGHYLALYGSQCMTNALLLALYGVQAFNGHKPCYNEFGKDMEQRITLLFILGFTIHSAVFVNQNYVFPYYNGVFGKKAGARNPVAT